MHVGLLCSAQFYILSSAIGAARIVRRDEVRSFIGLKRIFFVSSLRCTGPLCTFSYFFLIQTYLQISLKKREKLSILSLLCLYECVSAQLSPQNGLNLNLCKKKKIALGTQRGGLFALLYSVVIQKTHHNNVFLGL